MSERTYAVYILANREDTVLYIGVTNDLQRRLQEHREKKIGGFTKLYNVTKLVYVETVGDVYSAMEREKELKKLLRVKKEELIEKMNPQWKDLYEELFPMDHKIDI